MELYVDKRQPTDKQREWAKACYQLAKSCYSSGHIQPGRYDVTASLAVYLVM